MGPARRRRRPPPGSRTSWSAVIDTGIDYNHPDLAANIWTNPGEIPGNGIDDDGNGYVDDVHGYDFANIDGDPMDDHSHGTHVAGTIGAAADNAIGVAGVAPHVKIMRLRFLSADGFGGVDFAIQALNYAMDMKLRGVNIRLTNNSWGGADFSQAMDDAIRRRADAGCCSSPPQATATPSTTSASTSTPPGPSSTRPATPPRASSPSPPPTAATVSPLFPTSAPRAWTWPLAGGQRRQRDPQRRLPVLQRNLDGHAACERRGRDGVDA